MPMNQIFNMEDIEKKILLILRILHESPEPVGARLISRRMQDRGVTLSERGVRYHLKMMDDRGLTRLIGRHDGRTITEQGIDEIAHARVHDKIGFAISRIEILAYRTSLDLGRRQGLTPVNVSFFPKKDFKRALELMKPAFSAGRYTITVTNTSNAAQPHCFLSEPNMQGIPPYFCQGTSQNKVAPILFN